MVKCELHPRYSGILKPKSKCIWCWELWISEHNLDTMTSDQVEELLELCQQHEDTVSSIKSFIIDDAISRLDDADLLPLKPR